MKRALAIIIALAIVAALGFYVAWPGWSAWQIANAIKAKDAPALDRKIDFPSVRASLKPSAEKEIGEVAKTIAELDAYERDVLFPLATQKIEIDLDEGVKANYPKFGDALKPIKGLSDADD